MEGVEDADLLRFQSRLTDAVGLKSLNHVKRKVCMDSRRSEASISLNKSMETWIGQVSARRLRDGMNEPTSPTAKQETPGNRMAVMEARKVSSYVSGKRMGLHDECIISLKQAFQAHIAAFDLEDKGTICVEELIIIFERCHLFDELFKPNNVRNYFNTWVGGCNHWKGVEGAIPESGIGYEEFKDVLQWAADMTSQSITECAQKVVRLSRKLCDKSASVQRRLEVVFDAFCMKELQTMSAFEFGHLCQKVGVFEEDKFSMGDVYHIFYQINGMVHGQGIDFEGFILVLAEVGTRLEMGDEVYTKFANGVELLDTDEETINRVKMRLRQAAIVVSGPDWRSFFHGCDRNGNGMIDWDEFLRMCRETLHLADRDNHLRTLFDHLDDDGSGEINIEMLITAISPEIE